MYPGVELRLLRYTVVVAEELNFSRAARRLHVSQPSLSKQILQLEDYLGFKLFQRTKQYVEITTAGHKFVAEARKALHYSNRAVEAGKAADREGREALVIGYCAYVDLHFLSLLRRMKPVTEIQPVYRSSSTAEIVSKVLSHEWDAGLVILPVADPELEVKPLLREPIAVAVPDAHRLSSRARIELQDLTNESLILPPKHVNPQFHDRLAQRFRERGFRVPPTQEVANPHEGLHLASERLGIAVVQASASYTHIEGVAIKDIADAGLTVETAIALNRENTSPTLTLYLRAVELTVASYQSRIERKPSKFA